MEGSFLKKSLVFLFIFAFNLGFIYLIKKSGNETEFSQKDFVDIMVLATINTFGLVVITFLAKKSPQ